MENNDLNALNSASQARQILAYMQKGNRINPLEALRLFDSFRLGARIKDIEEIIGYAPERRRVRVENRYGKQVYVQEYWLKEEPVKQ